MKRTKRGAPADSGDTVAERRRRDLLDAAFSLIAERGLEGLRTRDVAARAGVNISTLHYYFGTKEALLLALVPDATSDGLGPPGGGDAQPTLQAYLQGAWDTFKATPRLSTVLQELALRGQREPKTRAAFRRFYGDWNGLVEDILRRQVADGTLRADLDPHAGAHIITSFIMGATVQLGVNSKAFDFLATARELERWLSGGRKRPRSR